MKQEQIDAAEFMAGKLANDLLTNTQLGTPEQIETQMHTAKLTACNILASLIFNTYLQDKTVMPGKVALIEMDEIKDIVIDRVLFHVREFETNKDSFELIKPKDK